MAQTTLSATLTPAEARALVRRLPAMLSGREADPTGLVRSVRLRVGMAALLLIKQAFVVRAAGERNPGITATVADVRELPFADESFDLIFSGSTLDHFDTADDIGRAVRELARVLRPAGVLVLTLDNPWNPLVWLRNGPLLRVVRGLGIVPYPVGVTLGPDALTQVVRGSGLEVQRVSAILHCPRVIAVWAGDLLRGSRAATRARFLDTLARWERLDRWPSRWMTAYFTAILAAKPDAADVPPKSSRA